MIQTKNLPAPENLYPIRRALLSVFDKTGIVALATYLHEMGVELISTGGTSRALQEAGLPVTSVSELTGYPEILDGRVKTLHPIVHAGLLARKTDAEDLAQLEKHGSAPIDLVVVNLYPFSQATASPDTDDSTAIENIDIGGPTMIRAGAKNFFFTAAITSPDSYEAIVTELKENNCSLSMATRRSLAHKAFQHTAVYDAAINQYFARPATSMSSGSGTEKDTIKDRDALTFSAPNAGQLRYGENPHQSATLYGDLSRFVEKLHGKDLSFNNIIDLSAALSLIDEFRDHGPTCAILKHTNPCGVAVSDTLSGAYHAAFSTDRQSPFGGIVIVNRSLDIETARAIDAVFTEIIIAPDFEEGVLDFLTQKKNRRLLKQRADARTDDAKDLRSVVGGWLVQDRDSVLPPFQKMKAQCDEVTSRSPSDSEWADLDFAWRVAKHVKSNAIVYAKNGQTIGIGAGQMSRIDASEVAVKKGAKSELDFTDCVVASDAFFPFADGLLDAVSSGARAAIQPGGSIRDAEVIAAAEEHNVAMVFTGKRHFRH